MNGSERSRMIYEARRKDVLVAYLLWLALGMFGAHRFYLDRAETGLGQAALAVGGLLFLVFGVGFLMWFALGVWTIVDAVLIPGMVREHNLRLIDRL